MIVVFPAYRAHPPGNPAMLFDRRAFLSNFGAGFGALALGCLLARDEAAGAATSHLPPRARHFPARGKPVTWLFMQGGPSQLETFDPKPALKKLDGQPLPAS